MATCKTCRFYQPGNCHRYPPQSVPYPNGNQHPVIYWPAMAWAPVTDDDWCGEHQPTEDSTDAR